MKKSMMFLSLLVLAFGSSSAGALCLDPTYCYCVLKPDASQALVRVEVSALVDGLADLRNLGAVYYDPQSILGEEPTLQGIDAGDLQLAAGQIWLIRVALEGEQLQIGAAVEETDGLLPCIDDSDFPGATADTVAGAVLSEDCRAAVHDLGVWSDCYDRQDSCGLSTATPPARPGTSFWVFLIFVFGLRVVKIR